MSAESLVIVRGAKFERTRDFNEQVREIAIESGIRFIKLHYTNPKYAPHPRPVKGWQAIEIILKRGGDGQKTYDVVPTKDSQGKDTESTRNLSFEPKKPTDRLEAELPDTPYNRRKLAICYYYGAQWQIVDPAIDAEIKAMADVLEAEYEEKRKKGPTKDDVIVTLDAEKKKLEEEVAALRDELNEKKKRDTVVKTAKKKAGRPSGATSKSDELENEIKQQVWAEKKDLIGEIQKKHKQWWLSIEYRQQVYPEIQRRLAERLKNVNNNAGAGVDNKK